MPDTGPRGDREIGTEGPARTPNTLLNALVGAAVTVFLSFVPFSPVLGGGVAGYLEDGDYEAGMRVGAISGAFALVPLLLLVVLFMGVFMVAMMDVFGFALAMMFVMVVFFAVYTIGLSALGGILGVYLTKEL